MAKKKKKTKKKVTKKKSKKKKKGGWATGSKSLIYEREYITYSTP